jgi:hypothetical protein
MGRARLEGGAVMPDQQYLSMDPNAGQPVETAKHPHAMVAEKLGQALQPENWPTLGGAVGGAIGGVGGTAFGMGFGGVPGGIAGATLGGGAGEAFKQLFDFFTGRPSPTTSGEAAAGIGTQGAMQGGIEAAGGALTKGAGAAASGLYRGYLKPALNQVDLPKARQIVETAIRERLPISKAGEDRAKALISDLNKQVNGLLAGASGGRVDLRQIADKVRAFAKQKYYRPGVPSSDFEAAMKVADEIDNHPSLTNAAGVRTVAVNPADANRVKQGLDTAVGDRAFGVERGAATEARKAGRHATRIGIENVAPQVGPLNAREAQIIDALEAVQKATGREENRNALFGVPSVLSGLAGVGMGTQQGDPVTGLATAAATRLALAPAVASRVALLASRFGRVPGTVPATAVRLALQVALSEQESDQPQQPQ